jgi:hypothetical protein
LVLDNRAALSELLLSLREAKRRSNPWFSEV